MNVNDGTEPCPNCGSGTYGSTTKQARCAEKAEARVRELETALFEIRAIDSASPEHRIAARVLGPRRASSPSVSEPPPCACLHPSIEDGRCRKCLGLQRASDARPFQAIDEHAYFPSRAKDSGAQSESTWTIRGCPPVWALERELAKARKDAQAASARCFGCGRSPQAVPSVAYRQAPHVAAHFCNACWAKVQCPNEATVSEIDPVTNEKIQPGTLVLRCSCGEVTYHDVVSRPDNPLNSGPSWREQAERLSQMCGTSGTSEEDDIKAIATALRDAYVEGRRSAQCSETALNSRAQVIEDCIKECDVEMVFRKRDQDVARLRRRLVALAQEALASETGSEDSR